jgi:hypothetical protein
MKITSELVEELNNELKNKECSFRYSYDESYIGTPVIKITLASMMYVDSCIINPTPEFFDWLSQWFEKRGITITYNNTGSTAWSI